MPYIYFVLAGLSLLAAMWLCVQRPPRYEATRARARASWHAARATFAAMSSTAAALCVLLGLGQLQ